MNEEAGVSGDAAGADGRIVLAHGGGGELTRRLLAERILPALSNRWLDALTDSAVLERPAGRLCLTTDAFVVQPLEFPGGDIGRLAVCGTVNDLAVMGAVPKALSLAMVIEEGLELALLERIVGSVAAAAAEGGVAVVTGDTKVVERRGGDGMTLTTAGVGELRDGLELGCGRVEGGEVLIINGGIAEHGLAVMSARKGLRFRTVLRSDVAPLGTLVGAMLSAGGEGVRFLRDPTRGGLAGLLADLAEATGRNIELDESAVPLCPAARHAAELLGLDPLTVANEGKVLAVVAEEAAGAVLAACRAHPLGRDAAVVGRVGQAAEYPLVELVTRVGGRRVVQRPYGEELPRIC